MLSSHLCLGLPSGLLPSGLPTKMLYATQVSHSNGNWMELTLDCVQWWAVLNFQTELLVDS
jgi:hypothetical protein